MHALRFLGCSFLVLSCFVFATRNAAATIIDVTIGGGDVIFLAGRTDIVIPAITSPWDTGRYIVRPTTPPPEAVLEAIPPFVSVVGGDVVRVADLGIGGINFLGGFGPPFNGPNGIRTTLIGNVTGIDGISGYNASVGSLAGVFLGDSIPNVSPAPVTLDFSPTGWGTEFLSLAPLIGQVFYIGDGVTEAGIYQTFVAPRDGSRLFFGLADANFFYDVPGYYGDNDGSYGIRVGINQIPAVVPEPSSLFVWVTGTLCFWSYGRRRLR